MSQYYKKKRYPSCISYRKWQKVKELFPRSKSGSSKGGRPPVDLYSVVNGIFYVLKTGCSWASLPNDFPNYQTVYGYFRRWQADGVWQKVQTVLVSRERKRVHKKATPTGACLDSQSVKTTAIGGEARGVDGGKKIKGRKRFILTDTLGLLLAVIVCAANTSEKKGAKLLLQRCKDQPCLAFLVGNIQKVWVDGGFRGSDLLDFVTKLWGWLWEITLRSDKTVNFQVLPKRWVVERTFAWFNHSRRLSKDYEKTTASSEAMVQIAMIRLLINRF